MIKYIILRTIGNFLVLFSLYGLFMTFGPAVYYEATYRLSQIRNVRFLVAGEKDQKGNKITFGQLPKVTPVVEKTFFGEISQGNKLEIITPVSAQFGLVIPKINANVEIYPNVDAGRSDIYLPILQKGVAHAAGTVFPGVTGNIFLFAHSTDAFWNVGRYNAIFYLLKELEKGDEINLFFMGYRHIYKVTDKKVVDPKEIHYLTEQTPFEQLTMQTCWPPGTTWKRLLVFARPEKDL